MIRIENHLNNNHLSGYLSPLGVWALAFGCAVGWGSFVMPGTTFLPTAGPLGSVLGLLIGGGIMLIIGVNYSRMMRRYPNAGGSYAFALNVLGGDHGFLCAWILMLTYVAIIWANATAMSLIIRNLIGDVLCFGFSYQIAGYRVYFGEVLLSVVLIAAACLVCTLSKKLTKWVMIICAVLLFGCITACFIAVVIHRGGLSGIEPLFSSNGSPAVQVLSIVILAPWAFIGFESISHSTEEFKFSVKKSLPIIIAAIITSTLSYIMLVMCSSLVHPNRYRGWSDYVASLGNLGGIKQLPTFYAASQTIGSTGLLLLGIAAFCGVMTGLIGNFVALSRLMYSMSKDGLISKKISRRNRFGAPWVALLLIACVSAPIPLLGRTAIGWIVDVTTIGATIVYIYVSVCSMAIGKREKRLSYFLFGLAGTLTAAVCVACYVIPSLKTSNRLSTESYLILILWSLLGMVVFRLLMQRDKTRSFGKSEIVWIILCFLILLVSVSWIYGITHEQADNVSEQVMGVETDLAIQAGMSRDNDAVRSAGSKTAYLIHDMSNSTSRTISIQSALLLISLAVVFSIFSIIKKREKFIEAERQLAEDNSRAKSLFLSNMSHDIRTPMNAVTGYTALALKEENLPHNVRDYLEKIDFSGKHLLSLINDILDMSRIESGKMELFPEPSDICAILDECQHIFSLQMESKDLTFTVDYSAVDDRYVICDKNRLNRVLLNLISNAFKFTPEGGRVDVVLTQTGKEGDKGDYELSVADTGIGMSPEFAERIFDAFERERNSTVSGIQGTGLGMAITKNLVELMDGSITLETEKDKGTKFTINVSFPITDKSQIESEDEDDVAHDFSGKRILVVEDNPINREIAGEILSQNGFEVDYAENGKLAVNIVSDADPDAFCAVLMDIQMPVMNGYEATDAIRAMDDERAELPIIAMTANSFESDRREALDHGMNAHISKPFDPNELFAVLAKLIK